MKLKPLRGLLLLLFTVALACGLLGPALAQSREALMVEVEGIISPVTQRYITRSLEEAEARGAHLVIIALDTPGGLLDSTRRIVEELLNAGVPTVVYVAPRGARAASAGTLITAAANFAVMAPGTNIGAATPVGTGGELPETLADKATNDAAALMRGIAQERNRNVEKLEATVLKATSYSAEEAVELGVVDFIAQDVADLLRQLHGRTAMTASGLQTLDTRNLAIRHVRMSIIDRFLDFLADPNVSFLLFSIGGLGIVIELFNPGLILPGVVGAICLILAFLSLGNLPVNWAGVALILLAIALFVAEIHVSGFGVLGVGAIVSFILGGLLLFSHFGAPSPTLPPVRVSLWVLGSTAGVLTVAGSLILLTAVRSRRARPDLGLARLVGTVGVAATDLAPRGSVQVESELWTAVSQDDMLIRAGERVKVIKVEGAVLTVGRAERST